MVLETLIMSQVHDTGSSATSSLPSAFPSRIVNDLPNEEGDKANGEVCKSLPLTLSIPMSILPSSQSLDDIQSPLIIRSEVEQWMGHELFKALSTLNHGEIVPALPSTIETSF